MNDLAAIHSHVLSNHYSIAYLLLALHISLWRFVRTKDVDSRFPPELRIWCIGCHRGQNGGFPNYETLVSPIDGNGTAGAFSDAIFGRARLD